MLPSGRSEMGFFFTSGFETWAWRRGAASRRMERIRDNFPWVWWFRGFCREVSGSRGPDNRNIGMVGDDEAGLIWLKKGMMMGA